MLFYKYGFQDNDGLFSPGTSKVNLQLVFLYSSIFHEDNSRSYNEMPVCVSFWILV